jgi:hypothetical protein
MGKAYSRVIIYGRVQAAESGLFSYEAQQIGRTRD